MTTPFTTVQVILDLIGNYSGSSTGGNACQVLRFVVNSKGNLSRYIRVHWYHRPTNTLMTNVPYTALTDTSWIPVRKLPPVACLHLELAAMTTTAKQPQPRALKDFPMWDNSQFREELDQFEKKWRNIRLQESILNYQLRTCCSLYPEFIPEPSRKWSIQGGRFPRSLPTVTTYG